LLDIARGDLGAALDGRDPARGRALRRVLIEEPTVPGAAPWAVLVGGYTFAATSEDVTCLAGLARLAPEAGAPVSGAASPGLLGVDSLETAPDPDGWRLDRDAHTRWQTVRTSRDARWLGLALPRVLLRLPYGRAGEPLESFAFEELSPGVPHEEYL